MSTFKETDSLEYVEVTQKEALNFLSAPRFTASGWTRKRMNQGNKLVAELYKHNGIPVIEIDIERCKYYKYLGTFA